MTTMRTIDTETIVPGTFPLALTVRGKHALRVDVGPDVGSDDTAPGPHDYFDAALAACKAETAMWYAKKRGYPLERVEAHVDRDDTAERTGTYRLRVTLSFHGPLDDDQKKKIADAASRCPIHKLMTTTDVIIEQELV
jgi:putative redox protein